MSYIAENGTVITDEMVDQWAQEADDGFPGYQWEAFEGNPVDVHASQPLEARTIRASSTLWDAIEAKAAQHGTTVSAWTRQALAYAVATS